MSRYKFMMIAGPLLGLIVGIWIGMGISKWSSQNNLGTKTAVRAVRITIDPAQRDELFLQLRSFAEKWRYAIRIAPLDPRGESFSIKLWRGDMNLSGLYPNDPGTLDLGFFYTDSARPVPSRYFDEEIDDLRLYINEVPGATLEVER